jgi:uncharacterized protein (DUF2062 family)
MPFMIFFSYVTGGWVLGKSTSGLSYDQNITLKWIEHNLLQYLVGSLVFSVIFGLSLGIIAYLLLALFRKEKTQEAGA